MKIVCEKCPNSCSNLPEWYNHLISQEHQLKVFEESPGLIVLDLDRCANQDDFTNQPDTIILNMPRFLKWSEEGNSRSIVVTGFDKFLLYPVELLEHFCAYGLISDFVFDPNRKFAVIQFDQRRCVELLTNVCSVMRGRVINIRIKSNVSAFEWIITMDLNAKYMRRDQMFFIRHFEIKAALSKLPVDVQLQNFIDSTGSSVKSIQAAQAILGDLQTFLRQSFESVYIYPRYPLARGFVDSDAIIEIFMDPFAKLVEFPGPGHALSSIEFIRPEYQTAIVRTLYILQRQTYLPGCDNYCNEVRPFPDSPPINNSNQYLRGLTFSHKLTGIRCRIRFDSLMEANVGSLLGFLLTIDSRVTPFLRTLFYWARVKRLTQNCPEITDILTSLALVFLMRKDILPNIFSLQQLFLSSFETILGGSPAPVPTVDGWCVSFIKDKVLIQNLLAQRRKNSHHNGGNAIGDGDFNYTTSYNTQHGESPPVAKIVMALLQQFFAAFGEIHYEACVLSPYVGDLVPKHHFIRGNENLLGNCFCQYKQQINFNQLHLNSPMVLQHCFNLSKNIAVNLSAPMVDRLKELFWDTKQRLDEICKSENPVFMDIFGEVDCTLKEINRNPKLPFNLILGIKNCADDEEEEYQPIVDISSCNSSSSGGSFISGISSPEKISIVELPADSSTIEDGMEDISAGSESDDDFDDYIGDNKVEIDCDFNSNHFSTTGSLSASSVSSEEDFDDDIYDYNFDNIESSTNLACSSKSQSTHADDTVNSD